MRRGKYVTQNASYFKWVDSSVDADAPSSDEDDMSDFEVNADAIPNPVLNANVPRRYPVRTRRAFRHFGQNIII